MRTIIHNEDTIRIDDGLFFGRAVFETILWESSPILLNEHLERLKKSLIEINLLPLEEIMLREYISKLNISNKSVKITVTPLNIIITERELNYKEEDYNKGMSLTVSDVIKNSTSRLCYIKSTCYIENLIEKENAKKKGYDDAIFINEKGYVTETSCANIFLIKDGNIITPRLRDGLLPGIIRNEIINNFKVKENSVTIEELRSAEEVFITNSLMGVMPVEKIDNIKFNIDRTRDIIHEFRNK